jgi:putative Mg2+ transporter-C (MgtC) family protein
MSLSFSYVGLDEIVLRLMSAVVLAFVIGLDREFRNKPFGLRTFMLVSLGAAAFSLVIMELTESIGPEGHIAMDPSRVAEGIIGGIGFLGAGAIIQGARAWSAQRREPAYGWSAASAWPAVSVSTRMPQSRRRSRPWCSRSWV